MEKTHYRTLKAVALALIGSLYFSLSSAQNKYDNVTIETTRLSERVSMLRGAGGNVGVFTGDSGVLVVDTQHPPLSGRLFSAIRTLSDKPIRYVINTHWHHDHTGGNANFHLLGAQIIAHNKLRTRLMSEQTLRAWNMTFPAMAESALPSLTYIDTMSLHLSGEEIVLKHPGNAHTDSDTIVFFRSENIIHMGDILASGRFPFIDRGAKGSMTGMIRAFDYAIGISDENTKVIPGHGDLTDRQHLIEYRQMLAHSLSAVRKLMDEGKSREQTIAAKPLASIEADWANAWMTGDFFTELIFDLEIESKR